MRTAAARLSALKACNFPLCSSAMVAERLRLRREGTLPRPSEDRAPHAPHGGGPTCG